MDFITSLAKSAISKGPPFPYTFHDRVDFAPSSLWTLHNGTQQSSSSLCSIFTFNINDSTRSKFPLARNAVKKWRTLRHPGVVKVLDSVETDSYIYVATERVTSVEWHLRRGALAPETIKWGLWSVAITLKFLNADASCIHGNVRAGSVFTSESGEWKLAGFEVLSSVKDDEPFIYRYGGLMPDSGRMAGPEIGKGGWGGLASQPIHVTDSWGFGILMYEAFNGSLTSTDQLSQPKKIPANMAGSYKRLIAANPKSRLSVAHFLEQGIRSRSYFDTPLIHISEFVENMGVKDESEREAFLDKLDRTGDQFPEDFFKMKILPELLKSVEYGGGGPKVFSTVLRIGDKLSEEEWETSITPAVVRLFSLPDRATRVFLLENLDKMIEHLSKKVVNDKIFSDMLTGFSDMAPIVREQSVKAVLTIIPKLSDRNINGDLLKHLAKTQNDEQPGIRTNTTICLGKIARHLGQHTRQKVLVAAFTRSLRDPFIHARNAALLALSATSDVFDENDCAKKVVPAISSSLVDKEKTIRAQAAKTLEVYLSRIKTLTASYPDTTTLETAASGAVPTSAPTAATATQAGAADGWAGWAISSFTKTIASRAVSGEMQAISSNPPRPASTPAAPVVLRPKMETTSASASLIEKSVPGGFLDDDGDMEGWGDMDDEDTPPPQRPIDDVDSGAEVYFDAPTPKENPSGVSNFGPKPFNIRPSKGMDDGIDFEALMGAKKKSGPVPKGLQKTVTPVKTIPVAKKPAPVKKQEEWKDDDDDDGDAWGTWDN